LEVDHQRLEAQRKERIEQQVQFRQREARKSAKKFREELAENIANGSVIINGIDTTVWPDPTFVTVIVSKETWEHANPPSLGKVFPAGMTHPGQWLEYAKTTQVFTQDPKFLEDVQRRILTRDVVGS
jgi:hypothetical protein